MTSELSGVPEERVLAIEETRDPKRAAIFAFARKLTREPASIAREDIDALRPHLSDAQIVELVFAVCRFGTMNRLADAFGVPLERENVFAPPEEGEGRAGGTPREASSGVPASVATVEGDRVAISAGSRDHVRVGDAFVISRGATYVGRITITDVDRDTSVGVFDEQIAGPGAPPQVGDRAIRHFR